MSRDPLNAQTRRAYGYVYNNPLNMTDPSGLCGWTDPFDCIVPDDLHVDTSCVTNPGSCDLPIPDSVEEALGSDTAHNVRTGAEVVGVVAVVVATGGTAAELLPFTGLQWAAIGTVGAVSTPFLVEGAGGLWAAITGDCGPGLTKAIQGAENVPQAKRPARPGVPGPVDPDPPPPIEGPPAP